MTKVVTVGIGGNDIGFSGIVQECATQNPFGDGCRATYVRDGRDELRDRIAATAPDIGASLAAIRARAPRAECSSSATRRSSPTPAAAATRWSRSCRATSPTSAASRRS